jgi:hypothetical protein
VTRVSNSSHIRIAVTASYDVSPVRTIAVDQLLHPLGPYSTNLGRLVEFPPTNGEAKRQR